MFKTSATIDRREFDRTLAIYRTYSKRAIATIVNTKAFYIARRATVETPKAKAAAVKSGLAKEVTVKETLLARRVRISKKGKVSYGSWITQKHKAPLAALIINARRGRHGEKGLSGPMMAEAVAALLAIRLKSVAFLKSGWLPAIKRLEPYAERIGGRAPRQDRTAAVVGQEKGGAKPAKESGWESRAIIENLAGENRDNKGALLVYGLPALQRAFDAEEASMREYIERKMLEATKAAGIATH